MICSVILMSVYFLIAVGFLIFLEKNINYQDETDENFAKRHLDGGIILISIFWLPLILFLLFCYIVSPLFKGDK